jgi:hypothetical protein
MAATVPSLVMEVSKKGNLWSIKTSTSLQSMELKFKGKETADGRDMTACVTLDGNKLVTVQKAKKAGEKSTKSVLEFSCDEVILTLTVDGVDDLECVQKFKCISYSKSFCYQSVLRSMKIKFFEYLCENFEETEMQTKILWHSPSQMCLTFTESQIIHIAWLDHFNYF